MPPRVLVEDTHRSRPRPCSRWAQSNLAARNNGFTGVSFSNTDTSKVWFEGTAHLIDALYTRHSGADLAEAATLLASLQSAQASAPNTDGNGIVAASSDGLQTGFGDTYYASLHTGATSWYILAAEPANPFVLGPNEVPIRQSLPRSA